MSLKLFITHINILTVMSAYTIVSQDPLLSVDSVMKGTTMVVEFTDVNGCHSVRLKNLNEIAYCRDTELDIPLLCDQLCRCTVAVPLALETRLIGLCKGREQLAISNRIITAENVWDGFTLSPTGVQSEYDLEITGAHLLTQPTGIHYALSIMRDCSVFDNEGIVSNVGMQNGIYKKNGIRITLTGVIGLCISRDAVSWSSYSEGILLGEDLISSYSADTPNQQSAFVVTFHAAPSSVGIVHQFVFSVKSETQGLTQFFNVPVISHNSTVVVVNYILIGPLPIPLEVHPAVSVNGNSYNVLLGTLVVPSCLSGYDFSQVSRMCETCPNLCSGNGYCDGGTCVCSHPYTGDSCSTYILAGVRITNVHQNLDTDFSIDTLAVDFTILDFSNQSSVIINYQIISYIGTTLFYQQSVIAGTDRQTITINTTENIIGDVTVRIYTSKIGDYKDSVVVEGLYRVKKTLFEPEIKLPGLDIVVEPDMGELIFEYINRGYPHSNIIIYYSAKLVSDIRNINIVNETFNQAIPILSLLKTINPILRGTYIINSHACPNSIEDNKRYCCSNMVDKTVVVKEKSRIPIIETFGLNHSSFGNSFIDSCEMRSSVSDRFGIGKIIISTTMEDSLLFDSVSLGFVSSYKQHGQGQYSIYSRFLNTTDSYFLPSDVVNFNFTIYIKTPECQYSSSFGSVFPIGEYALNSLSVNYHSVVVVLKTLTETGHLQEVTHDDPASTLSFRQPGFYKISCKTIPVAGMDYNIESGVQFSEFIVQKKLLMPTISVVNFDEFATVSAQNSETGIALLNSELRPREYQLHGEINMTTQGRHDVQVYTLSLNDSFFINSDTKSVTVTVFKKTPTPIITTTGVSYTDVNSFINEVEIAVSVFRSLGSSVPISNSLLNVTMNGIVFSDAVMRISHPGRHLITITVLFLESDLYLPSNSVVVEIFIYKKLLPCEVIASSDETDSTAGWMLNFADVSMSSLNSISESVLQYLVINEISNHNSTLENYSSPLRMTIGRYKVLCIATSSSSNYFIPSDTTSIDVVVKEVLPHPILRAVDQPNIEGYFITQLTVICQYSSLMVLCDFDSSSPQSTVTTSNTITISSPGLHRVSARLRSVVSNDSYLSGNWMQAQYAIQGESSPPVITIVDNNIVIESTIPSNAVIRYSLSRNTSWNSGTHYTKSLSLNLPGIVTVSAVGELLPFYGRSVVSVGDVSADFSTIQSRRVSEAANYLFQRKLKWNFSNDLNGVFQRLGNMFFSLFPVTLPETKRPLEIIFPVRREIDIWTLKPSRIILCKYPMQPSIKTWTEIDNVYQKLQLANKLIAVWNSSKGCYISMDDDEPIYECISVIIGSKEQCYDRDDFVLSNSVDEIERMIKNIDMDYNDVLNSMSSLFDSNNRIQLLYSQVLSLSTVLTNDSKSAYTISEILINEEHKISYEICNPVLSKIKKITKHFMGDDQNFEIKKLASQIMTLISDVYSVNPTTVKSLITPWFTRFFQEAVHSKLLLVFSSLNLSNRISQLSSVAESISASLSLIIVVEWILIINSVGMQMTSHASTYSNLLEIIETKISWLDNNSPLKTLITDINEIATSDLVNVLQHVETDSSYLEIRLFVRCLQKKIMATTPWEWSSISSCTHNMLDTDIALHAMQYVSTKTELSVGIPKQFLFIKNISEINILLSDYIAPYCDIQNSGVAHPHEFEISPHDLAINRCLNLSYSLESSPGLSSLSEIVHRYHEAGWMFKISFRIKLKSVIDVKKLFQIINVVVGDGSEIIVGIQRIEQISSSNVFQIVFLTSGVNVIVSEPITLSIDIWNYISVVKQSQPIEAPYNGRNNSLLVFVNHVIVAAGFVPNPGITTGTSSGLVSVGSDVSLPALVSDVVFSSSPVTTQHDVLLTNYISIRSIPSHVDFLKFNNNVCSAGYYKFLNGCLPCPDHSITSKSPRTDVSDCICEEHYKLQNEICTKQNTLKPAIGCPLIEITTGDHVVAFKETITIGRRYNSPNQVHTVNCICDGYTWCSVVTNNTDQVVIKFKTIVPVDTRCTIAASTNAINHENGSSCSVGVVVQYQLPRLDVSYNLYPRNHSFVNLFEEIPLSIYDYSPVSFTVINSKSESRGSSISLSIDKHPNWIINDIPISPINVNYITALWDAVVSSLVCRVRINKGNWLDYEPASIPINPWTEFEIQIASDLGLASEVVFVKYTNKLYHHILPVHDTTTERLVIQSNENITKKLSVGSPQIETAFWITASVLLFIMLVVVLCLFGELYKYAVNVEGSLNLKKHQHRSWIFPISSSDITLNNPTHHQHEWLNCESCRTPSDHFHLLKKPTGDVINICENCNGLLTR